MNSWLPTGRIYHTRTMIGLSLLLAGAGFWLHKLSLTSQIIILGISVGLFGLPHGALDYLSGKHIFSKRWGKSWSVPFITLYLAISGIILLGWQIFPRTTLLLFLLVSAWHFGKEDVEATTSWEGSPSYEIWMRGSLPILMPIGLYPEQTAKLFSWLIPNVSNESILRTTLFVSSSLTTWMMCCGLVVYGHFWSWIRKNKQEHSRAGLEILALLFLFLQLPPLLAFLVYFCGWHAMRHSLQQAATMNPSHMKQGLRRFCLLALPFTLLTIAGATAGWWMLQNTATMSFSKAGVVIVFQGLSALTFPHIFFEWWADSVPHPSSALPQNHD